MSFYIYACATILFHSFVIWNPLSGYLTYGQGDLALFSIRAAPEGSSVPGDGATQVSMLWDELVLILEELGSSFEDVIVGRENLLGKWDNRSQLSSHKATSMSCCFFTSTSKFIKVFHFRFQMLFGLPFSPFPKAGLVCLSSTRTKKQF